LDCVAAGCEGFGSLLDPLVAAVTVGIQWRQFGPAELVRELAQQVDRERSTNSFSDFGVQVLEVEHLVEQLQQWEQLRLDQVGQALATEAEPAAAPADFAADLQCFAEQLQTTDLGRSAEVRQPSSRLRVQRLQQCLHRRTTLEP
jgi:hypothetical protein